MSAARAAVVLVTGSTGFLGSHVVRRLHARGDEVHALARAGSPRDVLAGLDVHWHRGELGDAASLHSAALSAAGRARELGRPALVVHCGALISYRTRDGEAQRTTNVEGTRHLLAAARAAGFSRLLHVSSVVAIGHGRGPDVHDETSSWNSAGLGVDYATTKRAAEDLVREAARDQDVVIINPGAIFGAWERGSNTARFIREIAAGKGPLVAPPGSVSVLGIDDAADGCLLALDRGRRGERYLLVESWLSVHDLMDRIARLTGGRGPWFALPRAVWPLVLFGARAIDRIRPLDAIPPQALTMLGVELRFDARKARDELGWRPQPFDEVLRSTVGRLLNGPGTGVGAPASDP